MENARTIRERALREVESAQALEELEGARTRYLGRSGEITRFLRSVSELPAEERPHAGTLWNDLRAEIQGAIESRRAALADEAPASSGFDPTLPGRRPPLGTAHVLMQTMIELVGVFRRMGYSVADGPEIESAHYNFEALNIPEDHPTRDDHDSFFLEDGLLLRTQMSPVQIHVMEHTPPPVRVVAPGRVYRRDSFDASHSPYFWQMEGLDVGEDVTLGDLKGTLHEFVRLSFGETDVRFRASYFPFTEPSLELDLACTVCGGRGCPVCKQSGWVEILGCGMVHPRVLRGVGYDSEAVSGFAFGMGIDRITLMRHRIPDIRLLYENDLRFLAQFGRGT
jgi:phenylalanyl-tRNA synthetase alpha chain